MCDKSDCIHWSLSEDTTTFYTTWNSLHFHYTTIYRITNYKRVHMGIQTYCEVEEILWKLIMLGAQPHMSVRLCAYYLNYSSSNDSSVWSFFCCKYNPYLIIFYFTVAQVLMNIMIHSNNLLKLSCEQDFVKVNKIKSFRSKLWDG